MRYLICIAFACLAHLTFAQSSGAVVKAGLVWNDYLKDGNSIMKMSQTGTTAGLEVRLGAEDNTYFKVGGYYAKMHMHVQEHPKETQFFKVRNGYEVLKAICGLETRLLSKERFNWRLAATGAFNFIAGVNGNVQFADITGGYLGINLSTGIDLSFISIDLAIEPGFADFDKSISGSKPLLMMLTAGVNF
ncbi:MAG: hypothetical protein HKN76_14265 [Saprospiraceae bacterium]|nr:hypothetical protein [Saprospiraceae bacterium]